MDKVKDFLPKMAEAETELANKLKEDGGRERLDVENLEGEGQVMLPVLTWCWTYQGSGGWDGYCLDEGTGQQDGRLLLDQWQRGWFNTFPQVRLCIGGKNNSEEFDFPVRTLSPPTQTFLPPLLVLQAAVKMATIGTKRAKTCLASPQHRRKGLWLKSYPPHLVLRHLGRASDAK